MTKMVSTAEMVDFLYDQALAKVDEIFVRKLKSLKDQRLLTTISCEDVDKLYDLYNIHQQFKGLFEE
jgi:hypothetical protein